MCNVQTSAHVYLKTKAVTVDSITRLRNMQEIKQHTTIHLGGGGPNPRFSTVNPET
jgi:hypothetical protein